MTLQKNNCEPNKQSYSPVYEGGNEQNAENLLSIKHHFIEDSNITNTREPVVGKILKTKPELRNLYE